MTPSGSSNCSNHFLKRSTFPFPLQNNWREDDVTAGRSLHMLSESDCHAGICRINLPVCWNCQCVDGLIRTRCPLQATTSTLSRIPQSRAALTSPSWWEVSIKTVNCAAVNSTHRCSFPVGSAWSPDLCRPDGWSQEQQTHRGKLTPQRLGGEQTDGFDKRG